MLPVLLTALISWTVASLFMDIFSSIIDTLLVCYITEEESLSFVGSRPHRSRRRTSAAVRHFVCEVDTLSLYPESVTALSPLKPGKNEHQGKSSSSNIPMKATLKMRAAEQRAQERAMQEQLRATDALFKAREAVLGGGGLELEMGRSGQCESGQHESWDSPTSPMLADCQSTEKRTPLRARRSEGTARRDGALVRFFEGSPSSTGSYSPVVVA